LQETAAVDVESVHWGGTLGAKKNRLADDLPNLANIPNIYGKHPIK
jgi:hypothetical protein